MSYKITLSGKKDEAKKAVEEQSEVNIKAQTMSAESKTAALKLIDALPDGVLSGTIEDHNNGTVIINVTSKVDFAAASVQAASVKGTGTGKPMPGAAAAGRPDLAPAAAAAPAK